MKNYLVGIFLLASLPAFASKIEEVDFPDNVSIEKTDLVLNGMGLRKVEKFGIPFKVYVAALYLKTKSKVESEIIEDKNPRHLKMTFLRRVSGKDLAEAFESGHSNNCVGEKSKCEASKNLLKKMTDAMPDVLNKGTMEFTFYSDKVAYTINGRETKTGTIEGSDFSKNFLKIFLGSKPPTEMLKKGLLSQ